MLPPGKSPSLQMSKGRVIARRRSLPRWSPLCIRRPSPAGRTVVKHIAPTASSNMCSGGGMVWFGCVGGTVWLCGRAHGWCYLDTSGPHSSAASSLRLDVLPCAPMCSYVPTHFSSRAGSEAAKSGSMLSGICGRCPESATPIIWITSREQMPPRSSSLCNSGLTQKGASERLLTWSFP